MNNYFVLLSTPAATMAKWMTDTSEDDRKKQMDQMMTDWQAWAAKLGGSIVDQGKPLGPGTFAVCIEAAREHGTYQIIRKEVTIADKPFSEDLKGNVEIKSASIEYRRKGAGR